MLLESVENMERSGEHFCKCIRLKFDVTLLAMMRCFRYGYLCYLLLPIFVKVVFQLFCELKQRQEVDRMFKMT